MLTSIAMIFLIGLLFGAISQKLHLPRLIGMLITGIILGPYALNLIDPSLLGISAELRQIALIIILSRAGLSLNMEDLKKVGRPAILMCFLPACFELVGMIVLAPSLLGISTLDAAIMGTVIAAVSPAVIVPRMLKLMEEGYGINKGIPQLIMAGASVDDVFVIVLFSSFTSLAIGGAVSITQFVAIPISIISGIVIGGFSGIVLVNFFRIVPMRHSMNVIIYLSLSFLFVSLESYIQKILPFSGLLAVMAMGISSLNVSSRLATSISLKLSKIWIAAEVLLFVLVGATVDIHYAFAFGTNIILLIFLALILRMLGVLICLIRTPFSMKERLFCMIAYLPKATVQAAIGGIPLVMGLGCGKFVLTAAVLSILITAPLGAFGIDFTYKRLLKKENQTMFQSN